MHCLIYKLGNIYARFQLFTAARMMFRIVFWDVLPCKIIADRRFRGAYSLLNGTYKMFYFLYGLRLCNLSVFSSRLLIHYFLTSKEYIQMFWLKYILERAVWICKGPGRCCTGYYYGVVSYEASHELRPFYDIFFPHLSSNHS
jgi:hypothetical protein